MRGLTRPLAGTGRVPRLLFGAGAVAALAALAWPAPVLPGPPPPASSAPPAPDEAGLHRPLFDPGRRAWTARGDREAAFAGDPPRPVLTLRGVLIDGAAARALIDDGGEPVWLARGEGRGDWRVAAVGPDRVTLAQAGRLYTAEFMGRPVTLRPVRGEAGAPALRP